MDYKRMPIEVESPEMLGYSNVKFNLAESSVRDAVLNLKELDLDNLVLCYGDHLGKPELRALLAAETKNSLGVTLFWPENIKEAIELLCFALQDLHIMQIGV